MTHNIRGDIVRRLTIREPPVFFLKDLPTQDTLESFARRYPELDITALRACVSLLRTGSDLLTAFEGYLNQHGLSQGRFLTLVVMNRAPDTPANPSDLAAQVGVKPATMTGLLDGLERNGHVQRVPHPSDRRKVNIRLAPQGKALLDAILPGYYAHIASLMADVGQQERAELMRILDKVNQKLEG